MAADVLEEGLLQALYELRRVLVAFLLEDFGVVKGTMFVHAFLLMGLDIAVEVNHVEIVLVEEED